MTTILGISAFYHDSAAALLIDGQITAAAQEERFSRIKHDATFPGRAIEFCLQHAGLSLADLDCVVFYEKPLRKFDRLIETYVAVAPKGFRSFATAMPGLLTGKLNLRKTIRRELRRLEAATGGAAYCGPIRFVDHHLSHAASTFFCSPFQQAAVLVCDAVGQWATTSLGVGEGNDLKLTHQIKFPHSLGLLYSTFTAYCGFTVNSGEYKLMGLAPSGRPRFSDVIFEHLIHVREDGSFTLNLDYFGFVDGLRMTNDRFHRLLGRERRQPGSELTQFDKDVAASVQHVTEEVLLRTVSHLHKMTQQTNLCMAGGVALNCVANGRIQRESPFDNVWVQPAPGDAGGAIGAAIVFDRQGQTDLATKPMMPDVFVGPAYDHQAVAAEMRDLGADYQQYSESELITRVAGLLADGKIIGWMQGAMEFGPRALGNRSILADPRGQTTQWRINQAIKFRESFRPFAPVVLEDRAGDFFDVPAGYQSPAMSFVVTVKPDCPALPAITHVDGTARIQTVSQKQNRRLHDLLVAFDRLTACPVLVNTSFNVRDEPIVCTPADAFRCFQNTNLDALVIGDHLVRKGGPIQ